MCDKQFKQFYMQLLFSPELSVKTCTSYDILNRYAEPKPEVKYARTPGYRPHPEENPYNAWQVQHIHE